MAGGVPAGVRISEVALAGMASGDADDRTAALDVELPMLVEPDAGVEVLMKKLLEPRPPPV